MPQLDENDPGSAATRPAARADGVETRWFENRNTGGGITGTVDDQDFRNDILGMLRDVWSQGGITRAKGAANDFQLAQAIENIAAPRTYIDGFVHAPASGDPARDITVSGGGECRAVGSQQIIAAPAADFTKQVDAAWAAGNGTGGLASTAATPSDDFVPLFTLGKSTDRLAFEYGWDDNDVATNLLDGSNAGAAGFDLYRRIGWHWVDSAGDIRGYILDPQIPGRVIWATPQVDANSLSVGSTAAITATVSSAPGTTADMGLVLSIGAVATSRTYGIISPLSVADVVPAATTANFQGRRDNSDSHLSLANYMIPVDASSQLRVRFDSTTGSPLYTLICNGFHDARGAQ